MREAGCRSSDRRPHVHRRAGAGELPTSCARKDSDRAVIDRPRRRGRAAARRARGARDRNGRGDPAHPHPLRPRRRGRAGRPGHRGAGLLPGARDPGPGRHHGLRPLAGLRSLRELRRRRHRRRRRDARAGRPRRSRSSSPPATVPGTSPTRSRARTRCSPATSCSRARSAASTCPAATGRRCWRRSTTLIERLPGRDDRLSRPHGRSRRSGASAPPTRSCASSRADCRQSGRELIQAPRGTFDVLPRRRGAPRACSRRTPSGSSARAGYGRIETPTFEATELFARGVGEATDIVQKEMYTFDDGGGRSLTLRPEGHRAGLPRLPRARDAQAAAAGEALVPVELLPRRGAPARALPPVLAGRRRGDRLRRPRRPTPS